MRFLLEQLSLTKANLSTTMLMGHALTGCCNDDAKGILCLDDRCYNKFLNTINVFAGCFKDSHWFDFETVSFIIIIYYYCLLFLCDLCIYIYLWYVYDMSMALQDMMDGKVRDFAENDGWTTGERSWEGNNQGNHGELKKNFSALCHMPFMITWIHFISFQFFHD